MTLVGWRHLDGDHRVAGCRERTVTAEALSAEEWFQRSEPGPLFGLLFGSGGGLSPIHLLSGFDFPNETRCVDGYSSDDLFIQCSPEQTSCGQGHCPVRRDQHGAQPSSAVSSKMRSIWAPTPLGRRGPLSPTRTAKRRAASCRRPVPCAHIHYHTESIRCCGAGTAADTEFTTSLISSNMKLVARPFDGQETQSRHRHDHAEANAFPVRLFIFCGSFFSLT